MAVNILTIIIQDELQKYSADQELKYKFKKNCCL